MKKSLLTLAIATIVTATGAQAQISLTSSYSQDFNSYRGSSATLPTGFTTAFNGTLGYQGTGTGSGTAGGAYAFGSGSEFSLGALRSGNSLPGITYVGSFTNGNAFTITALTIAFDYKQFRYANTSGFDLSGTGALAGNSILNSKDFSGVASGTNGTPTTTAVSSFTLTGLSIAPGAAFGFSWATTDVSGSDNGVAIDNFSITAVPEPHVYALGITALVMLTIVARRRRISA